MAGTICNAFNKLLRTNGTLDSDEIFHEYVVYFKEDSCQISRQSNVPFSSADRFMHETHHPLFRAQFSSWRQSVIADEWHDRFSWVLAWIRASLTLHKIRNPVKSGIRSDPVIQYPVKSGIRYPVQFDIRYIPNNYCAIIKNKIK